jgi:hypothetical protein
MPRDGAIIFGDLIGKLDVLRVLGTFCPLAVLWAEVKSRGQLRGQKAKGKETYYQAQAKSQKANGKETYYQTQANSAAKQA